MVLPEKLTDGYIRSITNAVLKANLASRGFAVPTRENKENLVNALRDALSPTQLNNDNLNWIYNNDNCNQLDDVFYEHENFLYFITHKSLRLTERYRIEPSLIMLALVPIHFKISEAIIDVIRLPNG